MIRTVNISKAYSEVYAFINALGNDYIEKIPIRIYNEIKNNRDSNYNPKFDSNQTIKPGDISQEALALISALNLQYWCTDQEEKNKLKRTYLENTKKENEKYSYDNLFKNKTQTTEQTELPKIEKNTVAMVEYKESIFTKIKNWFKKIFRR